MAAALLSSNPARAFDFHSLAHLLDPHPDILSASTPWKKHVDWKCRTILIYQLDVEQESPYVARCVRIREQKHAEAGLFPEVFLKGVRLSLTFAKTVIGKVCLESVEDVVKILDGLGTIPEFTEEESVRSTSKLQRNRPGRLGSSRLANLLAERTTASPALKRPLPKESESSDDERPPNPQTARKMVTVPERLKRTDGKKFATKSATRVARAKLQNPPGVAASPRRGSESSADESSNRDAAGNIDNATEGTLGLSRKIQSRSSNSTGTQSKSSAVSPAAKRPVHKNAMSESSDEEGAVKKLTALEMAGMTPLRVQNLVSTAVPTGSRGESEIPRPDVQPTRHESASSVVVTDEKEDTTRHSIVGEEEVEYPEDTPTSVRQWTSVMEGMKDRFEGKARAFFTEDGNPGITGALHGLKDAFDEAGMPFVKGKRYPLRLQIMKVLAQKLESVTSLQTLIRKADVFIRCFQSLNGQALHDRDTLRQAISGLDDRSKIVKLTSA